MSEAENTHTELQNGSKAGRRIKSDPWTYAMVSGLVSGVITAVAVNYIGTIGFVTWIVCYILFIVWLSPLNRQALAIVLMLSIGYYGESFLTLTLVDSRVSTAPYHSHLGEALAKAAPDQFVVAEFYTDT